MAVTVDIKMAQTDLSALVERAAAGEEVVIARAGRPVARLVAAEGSRTEGAGAGEDAGIDPLSVDIRRVFAARYRE
jgi:prevent-host-death family protein